MNHRTFSKSLCMPVGRGEERWGREGGGGERWGREGGGGQRWGGGGRHPRQAG